MAKYTASPWGNLRGKLGGSVGGAWKGIAYARALIMPKQPGTITKRRQSCDNCIRGVIFKPSQMNLRRPIFGMLGYVAKDTLTTLIHPVWQWLCDQQGLPMTGINKFMKENNRRLYDSAWSGGGPTVMFSGSNLPDYTKMIVADGALEAANAVSTAVYSGATGIATITWPTATYGNGDAADNAWLAVYRKPTATEIGDYKPNGKLFIANTGSARSAGSASISIPTGLGAPDLVGFVFFNDTCANYSPSVSLQMT
jgi:hypothetical protein